MENEMLYVLNFVKRDRDFAMLFSCAIKCVIYSWSA